ncbi:MAG TPA: hypothetical protein VMB85_06460 [Bryobacteraceae bacterium]|nr:hypothetical protein [Bryobacteraceae bacterium]
MFGKAPIYCSTADSFQHAQKTSRLRDPVHGAAGGADKIPGLEETHAGTIQGPESHRQQETFKAPAEKGEATFR